MENRKAEDKLYFWISLALTLLSNRLVFSVSRLLTHGVAHHSLALPFEPLFPFLPWTISIYFGCFIIWFLLYRLIARLPREEADRFFFANLLGKGICLLVFVLFPTETVRPEVNGTSIWDAGIRFLYAVDAPNDLFPSIHCLIGWLCWAAVRGREEVSRPWRATALLMAALVCVSTLTTRQHVLPDVFAGILLAEICYGLSGLGKLRSAYSRFIDRLMALFPIKKQKTEP